MIARLRRLAVNDVELHGTGRDARGLVACSVATVVTTLGRRAVRRDRVVAYLQEQVGDVRAMPSHYLYRLLPSHTVY